MVMGEEGGAHDVFHSANCSLTITHFLYLVQCWKLRRR